ncbi:MAG: serine/threonine-protein phosphatase [Calothrix sp. C42_A2020_038]|nr:serine/threonine-protein phosphatase [Calothrix sp. C42_A2020_038]
MNIPTFSRQMHKSTNEHRNIDSRDKCEKCGADVTEIDQEGFCLQCGFRRELQERDHFEVIISPKLAACCNRGLRHHHNQDFVACAEVGNGKAYVMVVCDGVSSAQLAELASKTVAEATCRALVEKVNDELKTQGAKYEREILCESIEVAKNAVCAIPYTKTPLNNDPPSTTVVAAVVVDGVARIVSMGDSRAYWISPNSSQLLTEDDSWFYEMVKSGKLTEAEARQSPYAHAITSWLGADADNKCPLPVEFNIPGHGYLILCTDGLWNYAPEPPQMEILVKQYSHLETGMIALSLVEYARACGGHDNITVAVLSL